MCAGRRLVAGGCLRSICTGSQCCNTTGQGLDRLVPGSAGVITARAHPGTNMRTNAMAGTVPLLLVAFALAVLLRPVSAGANVSAGAHGDGDDGHVHDRGQVGPGPGPGAAHADLAVAARGAAAGADPAPTRSIGDDPGRSTLLARGRKATARGHVTAAGTPDKTPCRLGRARVGATLQV